MKYNWLLILNNIENDAPFPFNDYKVYLLFLTQIFATMFVGSGLAPYLSCKGCEKKQQKRF